MAITPELHEESFTAVFGGSWPRDLLAPEEGDLDVEQLRVLVGHLAGYTEADETCWFYYWVLLNPQALWIGVADAGDPRDGP